MTSRSASIPSRYESGRLARVVGRGHRWRMRPAACFPPWTGASAAAGSRHYGRRCHAGAMLAVVDSSNPRKFACCAAGCADRARARSPVPWRRRYDRDGGGDRGDGSAGRGPHAAEPSERHDGRLRPSLLPVSVRRARCCASSACSTGCRPVYNPDEVAIMARALSFARGTLNPHNFLYPTFYFYVLFAWVGVYLAFVWLTGRVRRSRRCSGCYSRIRQGSIRRDARSASAAGTATVVVLYRLGRGCRTGGPRPRPRLPGGVAAARPRLSLRQARCACDAGDRRRVSRDDSRVARRRARRVHGRCVTRCSRAPRAAWRSRRTTTASSWRCRLSWVIIQGSRRRRHGRSRGTRLRRRSERRGFFALSPFLLVEPLTAWRDIRRTGRSSSTGRSRRRVCARPRGMLEMLWPDPLGCRIALLALVGVMWMLVVGARRAVLLLGVPRCRSCSSSPIPRRRAATSIRCSRSWCFSPAWALSNLISPFRVSRP